MILKYLSDTIKQEWNRYYNKNKLQYEAISVRYLDGDSKSLYYTDKLKFKKLNNNNFFITSPKFLFN